VRVFFKINSDRWFSAVEICDIFGESNIKKVNFKLGKLEKWGSLERKVCCKWGCFRPVFVYHFVGGD